jgi:hypothetical protein
MDLVIKAFIKALTHNQFGLNGVTITNAEIKDIILISRPDYSITVKDINNIRNRKPLINNTIPKNLDAVDFINRIKKDFPDFKEDLF